MANGLGLRNVAFEVSDLQAAVDWAGTEGQDWSVASASTTALGVWPTSGPEGIIVSLAERVG